MNNFEELFQNLEKGVDSIAQSSLKDYLNQAKTDGQNVLTSLKENLQRWTEEVENGSLNKEDLEFLLQEEEALDELTTLKQAGLAEIRLDTFKNSLVNLITDTVFGAVKI